MFSAVTGVSRKRCPLPVVVLRRRLHSDRKRSEQTQGVGARRGPLI